jgi:RDD family protein
VKVRSELAPAGFRARYADPRHRYVATFAPLWRRAVAATIDWGIVYIIFLLVSIPLGVVQSLGRVSWEAGDFGGRPGHILFIVAELLVIVPLLGYWVLLLPTSQTFGMRAADIRSVAKRTGSGISHLRATLRSVVATAFAFAAYVVSMQQTNMRSGEELDHTSMLIIDACYVLFAIGCVSALAIFATPTRRSLLDRLFGTAMLDELEAVDPHMGPWGPMDAFDTSRTS